MNTDFLELGHQFPKQSRKYLAVVDRKTKESKNLIKLGDTDFHRYWRKVVSDVNLMTLSDTG